MGSRRTPPLHLHRRASGTHVAVAVFVRRRCAADELDDALKLFRTGKYEACLTAAAKADSDDRAEDWRLLEARTLLTLGRYPEAESVISNALTQMGGSIRLDYSASTPRTP